MPGKGHQSDSVGQSDNRGLIDDQGRGTEDQDSVLSVPRDRTCEHELPGGGQILPVQEDQT